MLGKFKTKKATEDFYREILYNRTLEVPLTGDDGNALAELYSCHPSSKELPPTLVSYYFIREHSAEGWKKSKCFYLKSIDGLDFHFSYKKAINGVKQKDYTLKAARYLIGDQTLEFKMAFFNGSDTVDKFHFNDCHVDHQFPNTFSKIFDDWMGDNSLEFEMIKTRKVPKSLHVTFEDDSLADSWSAFHNENSILRILSSSENLRLGNRGANYSPV